MSELPPDYGIQAFSDSHCFLCGIGSSEITQEHVFPKWLQRSFNLWTETIHLLNNTRIQYRSLTIPCCSTCNNESLSALETRISQAVDGGYEAALEIPELDWFHWLGKIFYGILRMELDLPLDRKDKEKGNIVDSDFLASFNALHFLLQGIRRPYFYTKELPFSVFICNLHAPVNGDNGFNFKDSLPGFTACLEMGEIGVILASEDGGLSKKKFGEYLLAVGGRKLTRLQFHELFASVSYTASRIYSPIHLVSSTLLGKDTTIDVYPPARLEPWNLREFAHALYFAIQEWSIEGIQSPEDLQPKPDQIFTWLIHSDGRPLLFDELGNLAKDDHSERTQ